MCRSSPEPTICLNQVTTVVISRAGTNLLSLSSAGSFMGNLSSFTPGSQRFARSLHRHPAINRANIFIKTLDVKASRKLRNTLPKYEKGGGEEMKTIHRKTSKDGYLKKNNTDRTRKKYGDLKKQSSSQWTSMFSDKGKPGGKYLTNAMGKFSYRKREPKSVFCFVFFQKYFEKLIIK